ncbi:MAG: hypothetical protein E7080_04390 [Bacteroidales bacterium]|nr:hypothetical protein [Bacteroidales bacterium]
MQEAIELYNKAIDVLLEVGNEHSKEMKSIYNNTTKQEEEVLSLLDKVIELGMIEVYPLKALLVASNNWSTFLIVRMGFFQDILLEGIEKGCLKPDMDLAWQWLEVATKNNDPEEFMLDMDLYYDILVTAAEEGNDIACDIMNTIWEPENIIEED